MSSHTISSYFVRSVIEGAVLQGYSAKTLLRDVSAPLNILESDKLRLPPDTFASLQLHVSRLLKDEALGLAATPQPIGSFKMLVLSCLLSKTTGESLYSWAKGINLLDNSFGAIRNEDHHFVTFELDCKPAKGINNFYTIESMLVATHRYHCWIGNNFIPIHEIHLSHPEPNASDEYRHMFYGAPTLFNKPENKLIFRKKHLMGECVRNRAELANLLQRHTFGLITMPRQGQSAASKARLLMESAVRNNLPFPMMEEVASEMALTPQTLRRHLRDDGYSYQELKEETRRDIAIHIIIDRHQSIEEVAFHLGFSGASNFIRAFKQWTGMTPLAYRKLNLHQQRSDPPSD